MQMPNNIKDRQVETCLQFSKEKKSMDNRAVNTVEQVFKDCVMFQAIQDFLVFFSFQRNFFSLGMLN